MNQQVLRTMAKEAGLSAMELVGSEAQTVRAIQRRLGMEACFSTDKRFACKKSCHFRSDCCGLVAEWRR